MDNLDGFKSERPLATRHRKSDHDETLTIPPAAWSRRMNEQLAEPGKPVSSHIHDGGHLQGLPLGGFGTGGIGRDYYGGFSRWTVKAGCVKQFCEPANFFAVHQAVEGESGVARVLYPDSAPDAVHGKPGFDGWRCDYPAAKASYHALFPKAWYVYDALPDMPVSMVCEQFSPVIPGDYRSTSLPVGVFVWHLRNTGDRPVSVSLLFSHANMVGWFNDFSGGRPSANRGGGIFNRAIDKPLADSVGGESLAGIVFDRQHAGAIPPEGDGQICIATRREAGVQVTRHVGYQPPGEQVWRRFSADGRLDDETPSPHFVGRTDLAGALAASTTLQPGECRDIPFVLAWDLPVIEFGSGRRHFRQYVKHVGGDGRNAGALAAEALEHHAEWSRQIDAWHQETTTRSDRPDWYYTMLFNELYLLVDGLTVWTAGEVDGPEDEHFGVIECPDYPYYNTVDLWVYGSFAMLHHWPAVEALVMRRLADLVLAEDLRPRRWLWKGERYASKLAAAVPHDFGSPLDDPFVFCNSYDWQDSNIWRDLNAQFVLLVYRDYQATGDAELLADCWPAVKAAMERLATFDEDGDGLIENTGVPDQTFDNIPLLGPGSYCNGLWLGALACAEKMARAMGEAAAAEDFADRLEVAKAAFDTVLWNGTHYRTDTLGSFRDTVFLEQLFGVWYAGLLGLDELVPPERMATATRTVYQRNFRDFQEGRMGALLFSGAPRKEAGDPQTIFNAGDCQTREVLCGINLAFAGHLMHVGMEDEALELLAAVHRVVYCDKGLWFRTPAAWNGNGDFRAIMNLRPLVIWAMEHEFQDHVGT